MNFIQLTVQPPAGEVFTVQLMPGQYTIGCAAGVKIKLPYEGVAEQHAVLWVEEDRIQVEPLVGGIQVNSYVIHERVEVGLPASVEFARVMLFLELKVEARPVAETESSRKTVQEKTYVFLEGRYELVCEIARGGMGKIYHGEDTQLGRRVAVKVSNRSKGGIDPRFEREAKVLAQLAHPNIVPIHATGVDGEGRPYYSMKLVKGRTLQEILDALAAKDPSVVKEYKMPNLLTIFRKVCDAMAFAHSKRILHRDLKPENIMVGEYGEVLVMDWGLAKTLGLSEERSSMRAASCIRLAI